MYAKSNYPGSSDYYKVTINERNKDIKREK